MQTIEDMRWDLTSLLNKSITEMMDGQTTIRNLTKALALAKSIDQLDTDWETKTTQLEEEPTQSQYRTMMVNQLEPNIHVGQISLTIVAKEPARFLRTKEFGGLRSIAIGRDSTGEIKLTLWDHEAHEVELGDQIVIKMGWVGEWLGDKILSTGRFGRLEIMNE